ncbi:MAG: AMP-binding protein [Alphaproteobacteria bacterium]|nr:AMP-binding protein [Alphaproteobacteria bacterium]
MPPSPPLPRIAADLRDPGDLDAREAIVDDEGHRLTHAGLHAAASAAAEGLSAARKGLVLVRARRRVETVVGLLAAWRAGHAVMLVDAGLDPALHDALVTRYRPEWIWQDGRAERSGDAPGDPVHAELALLLSTSGSTGSPRQCRLSAGAVVANARAIATALRLSPSSRAAGVLPLSYAYGLSVLTSHLLVGGSVVLTDQSPVQRPFWDLLARECCTSLSGVPATWQALRRFDLARLAPPSLLDLTQAGGRLAPALVRHHAAWVGARGGRFWVMYGQTEATARIAVLPPERLPDDADAVGFAIPGGALVVVGPDGADAAPGVEGEVCYRGPNVMLGSAETRADLAHGDALHGLLRTGDRGRLDADGLLRLTGRSSRVGKVFGLRLDLDEVEALVQEHGPTAVLGGEDEVILCCAWGDDDAHLAAARALAVRLRVHRSALRFVAVDPLPLTARGKVDYAALARRVGGEG